MVIGIDIGNTQSKVGIFRNAILLEVLRLRTSELEDGLGQCLKKFPFVDNYKIGWMSVAQDVNVQDFNIWDEKEGRYSFFPIKNTETLPIKNDYKTPHTLGIDRIVAIIGAKKLFPNDPVLVIDAGTALTYDFATSDGVYLGGGISPGIHMRFKSLHTFTAKLPLIEEIKETPLIGRSTYESMSSGVLNGILAEVEGFCDRYKALYGDDLKLCLTGGDASFFENHLKSVNFADENLTLTGIYHIITHKSIV